MKKESMKFNEEELIKAAEAAKVEKQEKDLSSFLMKKVKEFKEKNAQASIKELVRFLALERDKYIYGEKREREMDVESIKQDVFESDIVRMKPTKTGLFGWTLQSRFESVPCSISEIIKEIYPDVESWDEAFSAASQAREDLKRERE